MGDTLPFTIGTPEGGPGPGSAHPRPGNAGRVIGSVFALAAAAVGLLLTLVVAAALEPVPPLALVVPPAVEAV